MPSHSAKSLRGRSVWPGRPASAHWGFPDPATFQGSELEARGFFDQVYRRIEARLSRQRYLAGPRITEADWRLFTTLVRFDSVYHGHFKCNLRRLIDYGNLWNR